MTKKKDKPNKVVFTSVNAAYLPKALILARSLKKSHSDCHFVVLLAEDENKFDFQRVRKYLAAEEVEIIGISSIGLPNFHEYVFQRNVVELCTAVKGRCALYLLEKRSFSKVVYLDPDIVVFSPLNEIFDRLDSSDIILIPHQNRPATVGYGIQAELTSLQYGVYNLGFLAINSSANARSFITWWADRLDSYCFDDRSRGLFTDQKWCDLAPALFGGVHIARKHGLNTAPWNSHTSAMEIKRATGQITVGGEPLIFFHFSGFDKGEGIKSVTAMGNAGRVHAELYRWYHAQHKEAEKEFQNFSLSWSYAKYHDEYLIQPEDRRIVRQLLERKVTFGNPFSVTSRLYIEAVKAKMKRKPEI